MAVVSNLSTILEYESGYCFTLIKNERIRKYVLSYIDKIKGFEHISKLVSYSHCQLILGSNLI